MPFGGTWDTYRRKSVGNKMKEEKKIYYGSENFMESLETSYETTSLS